MRNLFEFLSKYYYWLLFVLLEAASIALLFSYNSYQGSVWFSTANIISGHIYEWRSEVESYFSLQQANKALTLHNVLLEQQLSAAKKQIAELTNH